RRVEDHAVGRPMRYAVSHSRKWSCGICVCVRPRWEKASLTALEKAETPPSFGDSPTPLAPIGWCGDGVVVKSVSQLGVSTAVGKKKSSRLAFFRLPASS